MAPETFDRIVSAATAFVVVEARHALPVIRRGRWRLAVALAVGMGGAGLAAIGTAAPFEARSKPVRSPFEATITPTLTVTPTRTTVATDTATPTLTPTATPTPVVAPTEAWAWVRTDATMRIQLCTGLTHGTPVPGELPSLEGCEDIVPYIGAPTASVPGQWYILRPGGYGYRIVTDPTPRPGFCEPVFVVVTATPPPTDTPTPTITPDAIATFVAGTLTALAPTHTPTPRPTDTRAPTPLPEATPTPRRYSLMLFPILQHRPVPATARPR